MSQPTSTRRPLARLATAAAGAVLAATAAVTLAPAVPAFADTTSYEAQFVADMNAARQQAGLRPYVVASDLVSVARAHSQQMAARNELYHNPNLTTDVQNWQAVGENVGVGPTVQDIHNAFMNSPEHRANILDHDFTQVGVGVAIGSDGQIWVTEDFREPMAAPAPPPPAPAPAPAATTTTQAATVPSAVTAAPAVAPARPAPSPAQLARQRLVVRLQEVQAAHRRPADPVAAALQFERTLATLTG